MRMRDGEKVAVRLGISVPFVPAPSSGAFVHICMQVLAVIVHTFSFFLGFDP